MHILEVLANAKVLAYLRNIIWDWVLFVQTASHMIEKEMTCGVQHRLVPGPLLWNIAFDSILKEEVLLGVSVICYTDNTLVVSAEDDIPMLEWKVNNPLRL